MNALLLGSIGTLADTSELQREAFNAAFRAHDLPWDWDRETYRDMLREAGGARRIAAQAQAEGREVDAAAIHSTKSRIFQDYLDAGRAEIRPGVIDLIANARASDVPLGFVTTTERANVDRLLAALDLDASIFSVVTAREDVDAPKPNPECYLRAAATLGVDPSACIAVEDNADGVRAALAAGTTCYAWPNANTAGHDFEGARVVSGDIDQAISPTEIAAA
ncbi:MAG: HAD-IA family hydrolase [Pseudomonadota bacterium]